MEVKLDGLLNLDDGDAADVGEGGEAAEPGEDAPAHTGRLELGGALVRVSVGG